MPRLVMEKIHQSGQACPDVPAIVDGAAAISYRELLAQAESVAGAIDSCCEPGATVALHVQRSADAIAAILGVFLAGRIYLPLDSHASVTSARTAQVLQHAHVLITEEAASSPGINNALIMPLAQALRAKGRYAGGQPKLDDPAYILFTSGSSGIPKGVIGTHRGLANLAEGLSKLYQFTGSDRCLQFSALTWDTSLEEILPALASGATLIVRPDELGTLRNFATFCSDNELTCINLPTTYWCELVRSSVKLPDCVRAVTVGGEAVPVELLATWRAQYGERVRLINTYGLTEGTAVSSACDLQGLTPAPGEPFAPIGHAISGVELRVVNDHGEVAEGEIGELVVLGEGVAAGYLNPAPTDAERFVTDPLTGVRSLHTGDLVRVGPDGILYYRGRRDRQLKIRGFRIEPIEIEIALAGVPGVAEAVVIPVSRDHHLRLSAFVRPRPGEVPDAGALRAALRELPTYMRPAELEIVADLPMLASGKTDRVALATRARGRTGEIPARVRTGNPLLDVVSTCLAVPASDDDSFLGLGGDSISAIVVASRLEEIGLRISPADLLGAGCLADAAKLIVPAARKPRLAEPRPLDGAGPGWRPPGALREVAQRRALTPMQQGILVESLLSSDTQVYMDQDVWRIKGLLDVDMFWTAWRLVVDRHSALRTSFIWPEGETPYRIVHADVDLPIQFLDWSALSPARHQEHLDALLDHELSRHIELATPPLMRFTLIRLDQDDHILVWHAHRLVLDGWSTTVVLDDFVEIFRALATGMQPELAPPMDYEEYVQVAIEPPTADTSKFWERYLNGVTPTPLPSFDRARPRYEGHSAVPHRHDVTLLPEDLVRQLELLARSAQVTASSIFRAAWGLLLSRFCRRDDVVFGATNSGRPTRVEGAATGVGLFINSLPVRIRIHPEQQIVDWLHDVQRDSILSTAHELTPLTLVQEIAATGQTHLFESLLIVQNYPGAASYSRIGDLQMIHVSGFEKIQYPLSLVVRHLGDDALCTEIWYDPAIVSPDIGQHLSEQLLVILTAIITKPSALVGAIPAIGERERSILEAWSSGPSMSHDATVLTMLERAAAASPDRVAVECDQGSVTYQELVSAAKAAAAKLRADGVHPGSVVAVQATPSAQTVAALLGILYAGCAYLGIDADLPLGRREVILHESRPALLIVDSDIVALDGAGRAARGHTLPAIDPASSAYIVYTSGSTGTPKGVVATHGGLANYAAAARDKYQLVPGDRGLVGASIAVDWFASELFPLLCAGATAVIRAGYLHGSVAELLDFCEKRGIGILVTPTALWHELVRELGDHLRLPRSLRIIDIGGERAIPGMLERWSDLVGDAVALFNGYGPTEATIEATSCQLAGPGRPQIMSAREVPIGRPLPNVHCYILDSCRELLPIGAVGELYVGGAGVTLGYLNDQDLTATRFFADHFASPGGRIYRTGDLARWLPGGYLEYLGRDDRQAKLAGNRFEPGEIEALLLAWPGVGEVWVDTRVDSDGEIVGLNAYVVPAALVGESDPAESVTITPEELRAYARKVLPASVVPSTFIITAALPRNASGKVDTSKLPPGPDAPESDAAATARSTTAHLATEDLSDQVVRMFLDLLPDGADSERSFLEAGGNSLLALRLIGRVRRDYGVKLTFHRVLRAPSLRELARGIADDHLDILGPER